MRTAPNRRRLDLAVLGLLALLLVAAGPADIGPKPTMEFTFTFDGLLPSVIESGVLLECDQPDCSDGVPLEEAGPQRFECDASSCFALAYGFRDYHQLELTFADGVTRRSNVFTKSAFAARYQVTVRPTDLLVEERTGGLGPAVVWPFVSGGLLALALCLLCLVALGAAALLVIWMRRRPAPAAPADDKTGDKPDDKTLFMATGLVGMLGLAGGSLVSLTLAATVAVEAVVGLAYARRRGWRMADLLLPLLLINLFTQPVLYALAHALPADGLAWLPLLGFLEIGVWLVEAALLRLALRPALRLGQALLLSLMLNAASFALGLLLPIS